MIPGPEEDGDLVPLPVGDRPAHLSGDLSPERLEPSRPGLDRRWRAVGLGALLAVLLGAVALSGLDGDKALRPPVDSRPAHPPPAGPGVLAARDGDEPAPGGWRRGSPGPLRHRDFAVRAWTGSELVVWGGDPDGDSGAAYDPTADRWRSLPAVPRPFSSIVGQWTGREIVVLGVEEKEPGAFRHWAAALDPGTARWRALPDPEFELAATAVWDGRRLVAWDQNLHAATLDPQGEGGWRPLPDLPVDFTDCSPQGALVGEEIFAEHCGRGALFHPGTDRWERIPHPRSLGEPPVWTGRDALFWVGSFTGSADGVWLYRVNSS